MEPQQDPVELLRRLLPGQFGNPTPPAPPLPHGPVDTEIYMGPPIGPGDPQGVQNYLSRNAPPPPPNSPAGQESIRKLLPSGMEPLIYDTKLTGPTIGRENAIEGQAQQRELEAYSRPLPTPEQEAQQRMMNSPLFKTVLDKMVPNATAEKFGSGASGIYSEKTGNLVHPATPRPLRVGNQLVDPGTFKPLYTAPDAAGTDAGLSEDAQNMMAEQFARTGVLPSVGFGTAGTKMRAVIANKAANIYKGLNLADQQAAFKANAGSLNQAQKTLDAVTAFENTAGKNLDMFIGRAQKVVDSGSPWINAPLRTVSQQGMGSSDLAAFNAARQVALTEIAKVTNNPNLTGQLSDTARKEIEAIMSPDATMAQIFEVSKTLKQDMANRRKALADQVKAIRDRVGSAPGEGGGKGGSTAPPAGATHTATGKDGKRHYLDAQQNDLGIIQ